MLLTLALIQIFLITWLCSGTRPEFAMPMIFVSALMLLCASASNDKPRGAFAKFLKVLMWIVLIVGTIQYFNPFCEAVNYGRFIAFRRLDCAEFLPKSVAAEFYRGNALGSMLEILAALATASSCMALFRKRKNFNLCVGFFAANAAAMAAFAIWQKAQNINIIYGIVYSESDSFGSFFLSNAAAAFLNLGFAASAAMALGIGGGGLKRLAKTAFFLICAAACAAGAWCAGSIAGRILCVSGFVAIPIVIVWRGVLAKYSFRASMAYAGVLILAAGCAATALYPDVKRALSESEGRGNPAAVSYASRAAMYKISKDIILERPIWGSGGNSGRYLISAGMAKSPEKNKLAHITSHAHSDFLEYVMDFGLFGGILILAAFALWLRAFVVSIPGCAAAALAAGIFITLLHSCIDMNLHILSTMLAVAILAAAAASGGEEAPKTNGGAAGKFAGCILALLFGAAAVCGALKAYDFGDSDADIAHSIMAERARAYGDESGAAAQRAKIKNPRFIAEDGARFADLKVKILRGEFDKSAVSEQIEDAAQGGGKALLYALAAASALKDGAKEADGFLFAARCALLGVDARLWEQYMLEAAAALSGAESKAAQELALDIAMKLQYSYDKALLMCGLMSKKYAREKLEKLLKADRKKYAHYLQFINIGNLVSAKDLPDALLEKRLKYFANQFGISWRIEKVQDYKLPMMAYVFKMRGERGRYALYREKSLSKEQLENMKAGYFPYVEYAAKVFCMAGDFDAAIDLLKVLPKGHKKNLVLKRLVRYLTMSREGYEKTAAAGVL